MRKRIAALGALLLALIGIAVITPAGPAQALNSTGVHTVSFSCVSGAYNLSADFTYSLTYTGVDTWSPPTHYYTFQMLSSTFHGTTPPSGRSPSLGVGIFGQGNLNGEQFVSAGFGGDMNITTNYVWPKNTAVNNTTLTNGVSWDPQRLKTLAWQPITITTSPQGGQGNNRATFVVYNVPACSGQYIDLGFPDAPRTGPATHHTTCDGTAGGTGGGLPSFQNVMDIGYTVSQVTGTAYSVKVTNAEWTKGVNIGIPSTISLKFSNPGGDGDGATLDSGSPNWTRMGSPPGDYFHEVDGLFGVSFPTKQFQYRPGNTPKIVVKFEQNQLAPNPPIVCTDTVELGFPWSSTPIGSDPAYETIVFDDCSTNPTELRIKPIWQKTTDGATYRLTALSIYQSNSSGSKIVLNAGTATILGGVTVAENKTPTKNLVTINSNVSLANRTITSGETQTFPVATAGSWTRVQADATHSTAPSSFYTPASRYPTVILSGHVYNAIGAECVPSEPFPGGSGDIRELEFQPIDLF